MTASFQSDVTGGLPPYARQRNAPEHLEVVSWAPGKKLANLRDYLYGVDWRVKPTVYIIDSGVDLMSTVSICRLLCPCRLGSV